jgi:hypothetical protein
LLTYSDWLFLCPSKPAINEEEEDERTKTAAIHASLFSHVHACNETVLHNIKKEREGMWCGWE